MPQVGLFARPAFWQTERGKMMAESVSVADQWVEGPVNLPPTITHPCQRFLCEYFAYMSFVREVFDVARFADRMVSCVTNIHSRLCSSEQVGQKSGTPEKPGPAEGIVKIYQPLIAEMVFCRGVDNFLTYVAQLLGEVFRERPETLKSQRTERLENLLEFSVMDELIDYLAEKRVCELGFKGIRDLREELSRELSFDLFPEQECLARVINIIESRNLIVHNRSVVNTRFLSRTGLTYEKGTVVQQGLLCAQRCMRFLAKAAVHIDARAAEKFRLGTREVSEECKGCVRQIDESIPAFGEHVCDDHIWPARGEGSARKEGA